MTAESKPSEKAVKTGGKKKKKKGESKETLHRLSAAEASASPQGVEPRVKTATDFGPGQEAVSEGDARLKGHGGANPVLRPPGAQMIGESKSSSGSGGKVEKRGGLTEESGQRRQEDLEPGPGIAATPAPSDRPGVGAGAGSGAAEAADVINDQQAVESWICQSHLVRYPHDACSEVHMTSETRHMGVHARFNLPRRGCPVQLDPHLTSKLLPVLLLELTLLNSDRMIATQDDMVRNTACRPTRSESSKSQPCESDCLSLQSCEKELSNPTRVP